MILTFTGLLIVVISLAIFASFKIEWGLYLDSTCIIRTDLNEVVLTFDDGPHPEYTPELLDLLKERNIKATFFVIGENAAKYPEIIQRIVNEGHKIGIHSFYHKPSFTYSSKQAVIKDLTESKTLLEKIVGNEITLFRPPYGVTNPNIAGGVRFLNLKSVGWSIRSLDTVTESQEKILAKIERSLFPGAIILLHDRLPDCVSLLIRIISVLDNNGYKTVNL